MYILANGKEVKKSEITKAFKENRCGIVNNSLVISGFPINYSKHYVLNGVDVILDRPLNINHAVSVAYL